jgi:uncharacterized membrane protein
MTAKTETSFDHRQHRDPDVEAHRVIAALGYLGILSLIPLLMYRTSAFAQFHGRQGFVLFVIWLISSFFFWIPFLGAIHFLFLLCVTVLGFVKAYNGEFFRIPVIYDWSLKIRLS